MDGSGHRDLGDIRRWKTLPPAPAPNSIPDVDSDAPGLLAWLASGTRALEKAGVEPAWAVDDAGLAVAMSLLGQLRSLTDRLEVTITSEVLTRGTADATGLSPVDWIVDQQGSAAPRPDPRRVATVVRVAEAGTSRETGRPGDLRRGAGGGAAGALGRPDRAVRPRRQAARRPGRARAGRRGPVRGGFRRPRRARLA
jgi:hypothetical protein